MGWAKITIFQKSTQKLYLFEIFLFTLHRFFEKQEYRYLLRRVSLQKKSSEEIGKKFLLITYKPISYIFRKQ